MLESDPAPLLAASPVPGASCLHCRSTFNPRTPTHRYCSTPCCQRARDLRRATDPAYVYENRARFARWREAQGIKTGVQPWLFGPPPHGTHLDTVATSLSFSPVPRWPIELRSTWQLHGMLHHLLGEPHDRNRPSIGLLPWADGWAVLWHTPRGHQLAQQREHRVFLFGEDRTMRLGPVVRLKCPVVTRRGRRRLRIDAVTPVCIRSNPEGARTTRTCPEAENIRNALLGEFPGRLGLTLAPESVCVELVERHTQPETTPQGGKYPPVRGFVGHLTVEVNAVAHWLLICAERLGLGGRTGFGFGRIRLTEVER